MAAMFPKPRSVEAMVQLLTEECACDNCSVAAHNLKQGFISIDEAYAVFYSQA
jgi:hypothetical protein